MDARIVKESKFDPFKLLMAFGLKFLYIKHFANLGPSLHKSLDIEGFITSIGRLDEAFLTNPWHRRAVSNFMGDYF